MVELLSELAFNSPRLWFLLYQFDLCDKEKQILTERNGRITQSYFLISVQMQNMEGKYIRDYYTSLMNVFTPSYSHSELFECNHANLFILKWETMMVERLTRKPIVWGERCFDQFE